MQLVVENYENVTQRQFVETAFPDMPWLVWGLSIRKAGESGGWGSIDPLYTKDLNSAVRKYKNLIKKRGGEMFSVGDRVVIEAIVRAGNAVSVINICGKIAA